MSMLNFYINRAGRSLPPKQRRRLERSEGRVAARVRASDCNTVSRQRRPASGVRRARGPVLSNTRGLRDRQGEALG